MEYEIKITITEEQLSDMLDTAFNSIAYWTKDVYAISDCEWLRSPSFSDYILLGKGIIILPIDAINGKTKFPLTKKRIKTALSMCSWFDWDTYDSWDADRVIQIALFGKIVYA